MIRNDWSGLHGMGFFRVRPAHVFHDHLRIRTGGDWRFKDSARSCEV